MASSRPVAPGNPVRGGPAEYVGLVLGGRFRLLAPIGTGASAHVFLAEDVVLRRRVAVKILHRALAEDEGFLRRFRAEAQAAAALNHPNVMRVFDSGEGEDGPYLVLEYLSGGSLRDLLDAGHRLTPSQALLVGLEAGRALDYAHRRGLVHRDIKPANLLFDDEGRLRIADFGLARALAEAAWTEPAGAILGTARYAAPEQAQAQPLDGRADVYSLALVMIESVTGTVPFAADTTVATLMARVNTPVVAPAALGVLGPVVEAAGTADPGTRIDASELVRSLDRVAGDLPTPKPLPIVGDRSHDGTATVAAVDRTEMAPARAPATAIADEGPPGAEMVDEGERRRRRWPLRVLTTSLVVVLALAAAALAVQLGTPEHPIPNVAGLTEAGAKQRIEAAELKFKLAPREFSETVAAGDVIGTDPPAQQKLEEGKAVSVVVSKGPAPRTVPDLANLTEAEAVQVITDKQLTPVVEQVHSEDVEKGRIVNWEPREGVVEKGGEVKLRISAGPEPRTLPDVAGQSYDEAAATLSGLGLVPKRADVFDDDVKAGLVVGTKPGPGQKANKGDAITVNVSKGPDLVAVPDVTGMDLDDAADKIEEAGLRVISTQGPFRRKVYASDPPAGTKVRKGSGVTLYTR